MYVKTERLANHSTAFIPDSYADIQSPYPHIAEEYEKYVLAYWYTIKAGVQTACFGHLTIDGRRANINFDNYANFIDHAKEEGSLLYYEVLYSLRLGVKRSASKDFISGMLEVWDIAFPPYYMVELNLHQMLEEGIYSIMLF
jgi:hypothetical protein